MKANLYYKDIRIIDWTKNGRYMLAQLENGQQIKRELLIKPDFSIQCETCKKKTYINFYYACGKKVYECCSCRTQGERNPFFQKKHSVDVRDRISKSRVGQESSMKGKKISESALINVRISAAKMKEAGTNAGKNNPFYGKKHTKELMSKITKQVLKTKSEWTEERKKLYSETLSNIQKRLKERDYDQYIKNKIEAGKCSMLSQLRKYKKNRIESIVEEEMNKNGLYPKYSIILGYYQFDFGFKDHKILLEVQGDYWHGNPNKFNEYGTEGKRRLNDVQKEKMKTDIEKEKFAIENNLKIFYIWEEDVMCGNFDVVNKIKNEIQNNKTNCQTDSI